VTDGLIERLRDPHYLGDDAKARLPEPAADLIFLLRAERREAANRIEALEQAVKPFAGGGDVRELIDDLVAGIEALQRERDEACEQWQTNSTALDSMQQNRDVLQRHFDNCTIRAEQAEAERDRYHDALVEIANFRPQSFDFSAPSDTAAFCQQRARRALSHTTREGNGPLPITKEPAK
jgi:hypothetical protein